MDVATLARYARSLARAEIPQPKELLVTRRGDALLISTVAQSDESASARVHELALVDGRVRTIDLGRGVAASYVVAGDWIAWSGHDDPDVRLIERFELRRIIATPPGFRTWSLDVSSTGAIARVVTDDASTVLEVARGDLRSELVVPPGTEAKWA